MNSEQQFKDLLVSRGQRLSSPRLQIFRLIARKSPLTSQELVILANESAIDPATTYRTLKLFRELELIRDLVSGGRRLIELSDDLEHHHHHFWCTKCGKLEDFDSELIEASIDAVGQDMDVTIASHQLEVTGLCADCRLLG